VSVRHRYQLGQEVLVEDGPSLVKLVWSPGRVVAIRLELNRADSVRYDVEMASGDTAYTLTDDQIKPASAVEQLADVVRRDDA
jgi:hypothetical protein